MYSHVENFQHTITVYHRPSKNKSFHASRILNRHCGCTPFLWTLRCLDYGVGRHPSESNIIASDLKNSSGSVASDAFFRLFRAVKNRVATWKKFIPFILYRSAIWKESLSTCQHKLFHTKDFSADANFSGEEEGFTKENLTKSNVCIAPIDSLWKSK